MPQVLKDLLSSKKFLVMILSLLGAVGVQFLADPIHADKLADIIVMLGGLFLGSQGLADLSKAKAQIENKIK